MPRLCVGLTGGIASGKSLAGRLFQDLSVAVIDADQVSRDLVAPGSDGLREIVSTFGEDVLDDSGSMDRARMRERVFGDAEQRSKLEAILHPRIAAELQARRDRAIGPYCILMVPLLARLPVIQQLAQRILVVDCPVELQRQRLLQRDAISAELADAMIAAQASREQRLALADDVITNDRDIAHVAAQVADLHGQYLTLAGS